MIRLKHGVQALLGGTFAVRGRMRGASNPGDAGGLGVAGSSASSGGPTASGGQSLASAGTDSESGPVGFATVVAPLMMAAPAVRVLLGPSLVVQAVMPRARAVPLGTAGQGGPGGMSGGGLGSCGENACPHSGAG